MLNKKILFSLILIIVFSSLLTACGSKSSSSTSSPASSTATVVAATPEATVAPAADPIASLTGKKIALIIQLNLGTFSAQYIDKVAKT